MATTVIGRQFIRDVEGNAVVVILPLEEFALVEEALRQFAPVRGMEEKLVQIQQAVDDILFMDDLRRTMSDFAQANAKWWEPAE